MIKLTAKDLMIGDWVQNPLGYKAQVLAIKYYPKGKADGNGGYYATDVGNGGSYQTLYENDIQPIPLTKEILEKNGFTKCNNDEDGAIQYEFGESNLGIDIWVKTEPALLGAWRQWDDYNEPYSMVNELPINYVHELQHALKLCGIDKEIILYYEM